MGTILGASGSSPPLLNVAVGGVSFPARNASFINQGDGIEVPQYHRGAYIALAEEDVARIKEDGARKVVRVAGGFNPQIWLVRDRHGVANPLYRPAKNDRPLLGFVYMREVSPEVVKFEEDPIPMTSMDLVGPVSEAPRNAKDAAVQAAHGRARAGGAAPLGAGAIAGQ